MRITQEIYCPNCGSQAERQYFVETHITQTQCPVCDYLMINCSRTGRVLEAHAPGIYPQHWNLRKVNLQESKALGTRHAAPQEMALSERKS